MPQGQLDLSVACQRHRLGRVTFTPPTAYADASCLHVERIENDTTARRFVELHHYARTFPAAIASFGMFETSPSAPAMLVGVATFSVPMNVARSTAALLRPGEAVCELGRFTLLDRIGHGAETRMLSLARAGLGQAKTYHCPTANAERPKYPIIVSFSDPVPRADHHGTLIHVGHLGRVYQGGIDGGAGTGMGLYTGRGAAKTMWLTPDASAFVDRTLNKLRNGEVGDAGVYDQLLRHGAPLIRKGETGRDYVTRALRDGPFRRVHHRGTHRYLFLAGSRSRKRELATALGPGLPYPRWTDAP